MNLSEPTGFYMMKFICNSGKLLKNAPGNYECRKTYRQPYDMCKLPYWELVEDTPILSIPPSSQSDSVFEEPIYVPEEDTPVVEETSQEWFYDIPEEIPVVEEVAVVEPEVEPLILDYDGTDNDISYDSDAPATISAGTRYNFSDDGGKLTYSTASPEEKEDDPNVDREELKKILTEAGIGFNIRSRTSTLKRLVDDLNSEE